MKIQYNSQHHIIIYDSLYTEPLMTEAFKNFLEKEKNISPFLYQLELKKWEENKHEVEDFYQAVDNLRDDVARLVAKLERVEAR